MKICNFC